MFGRPVTLEYAGKVVNVLKYLERAGPTVADFRFYIERRGVSLATTRYDICSKDFPLTQTLEDYFSRMEFDPPLPPPGNLETLVFYR